MGLFIRFTISFTVILGGFVGSSYVAPAWAEARGIDFWSLPELSYNVHKAEERAKELQASREHLHERLQAKDAILLKLIDGDLNLKTATEQLRAYCDDHFLHTSLPYLPVDGKTVRERFCRAVIYWVEMRLRHEPERRKTVLQKIKAQLPATLETVHI